MEMQSSDMILSSKKHLKTKHDDNNNFKTTSATTTTIKKSAIRAGSSNKNINNVSINDNNNNNNCGIETLPPEILIEIFSYLTPQDLHTLERVSEHFARIIHKPLVWKTYEVKGNDPDTCAVIDKLKKMPLLKRITIRTRSDCDDILRQLSRTNRRLEKLCIIDCTGSTGRLYLRSCNLIRILERCNRLHTIHIFGSRFYGNKFYCLLGDMNTRLRRLSTQATSSQFRAFTKHANHLNEHDKEDMYAMCNITRRHTWAPFHYFLIDRMIDTKSSTTLIIGKSARTGGIDGLRRKIRKQVLVTYLDNNFLSIDVSDTDQQNSYVNLHNCP